MLRPDEIGSAVGGISQTRVISGDFNFRVNDGPVVSTTVHLMICEGVVVVRYGDGVDHVARRGDDAVAFFANGLAPSLMAPVAR